MCRPSPIHRSSGANADTSAAHSFSESGLAATLPACREVLCRAELPGGANEFREALSEISNPDGLGLSHINLGKIFDVTGQRAAINEYNLAIRTKDDTNGAQAEAARYLKTPYQK